MNKKLTMNPLLSILDPALLSNQHLNKSKNDENRKIIWDFFRLT